MGVRYYISSFYVNDRAPSLSQLPSASSILPSSFFPYSFIFLRVATAEGEI